MGVEQHHVIIVQDYDPLRLKVARDLAISMGLIATPTAESPYNGWISFMIVPDGSKDGWEPSNHGNQQRALWMQMVEVQCLCHVIEFSYGEIGYSIKDKHHKSFEIFHAGQDVTFKDAHEYIIPS